MWPLTLVKSPPYTGGQWEKSPNTLGKNTAYIGSQWKEHSLHLWLVERMLKKYLVNGKKCFS